MQNPRYSFTQQSGILDLLISNPNANDSGKYKCQIEWNGEILKSISHSVDVKPEIALVEKRKRRSFDNKDELAYSKEKIDSQQKQPIAFESFMKNLTIEAGNRAKFICSVVGNVTSVEWFKDSIPLQLELDRRYHLTNSDGLIGLEIHNIVTSDSGFYTCTIHGQRNSVTSSSKLTVYDSYESRKKSIVFDRPPIRSQLTEYISKGEYAPTIMIPFFSFVLFFTELFSKNKIQFEFS